MTPTEFRAALATAGYNQTKFAAYVGVKPRQVRRWAAGDTPVPQAVVLLLQRP